MSKNNSNVIASIPMDGSNGWNPAESNSTSDEALSKITESPSFRSHKLGVCACWFSFFAFGMADGTTGALSPYIQDYYSISYTIVSLLFLCQVLGYGVMSLANQHILSLIGRRWNGMLGAALMCTADILILFGPPFPVVVIAFVAAGFAAGIFEAMMNAYAGSFKESSMIFGVLHGCYGLGAAVAPLISTQMVVHGITWHWFYGILLGVAILDLVLCGIAFWNDTAAVVKLEEQKASERHATQSGEDSQARGLPTLTPHDTNIIESGDDERKALQPSTLNQVLHNRFCLVGAVYIFLYLGLEISTGGWIVQYLQKVRHGGDSSTGFVNSGFWFGLTLGRFILSWPASHLLGEWWACQIFMTTSLGFELIFWLAPGIIAPSIGVSFMGFFIGPTFPLIMEIATKNLDPKLHVTGIGFIAAFGSIGGAVLPFVIGLGATAKGPKIVPYVLTALLAGSLIVWMFLPGREPLKFLSSRKQRKVHSRKDILALDIIEH